MTNPKCQDLKGSLDYHPPRNDGTEGLIFR